MAHVHFRRTTYPSGGAVAGGRVDYIMRADVKRVQAHMRLDYIKHDSREDLVYTTSRNLPAWANSDPHRYFHAAERYERANGVAFEEWKITLPQELTHGENMALMRDLVEVIAGDRLPITYAFHAPETLSKSREQPHLHLLISGRMKDAVSRTSAQHFKRYNAKDPTKGGARKDPALNHLRAVKAWRVTITDVVNLHLERAGRAARVHPDRLDARGIDRTPEPKLRPSESRAYRNGTITPRMQEVLDVRAARLHTRATEEADARAYWVERKAELGLDETLDAPAQLARVGAAREAVRDHAPVRTVERETVTAQVAHHARDDVTWEADDRASWADVAGDMAALTARVSRWSDGHGRGARVRLFEREQGQGL